MMMKILVAAAALALSARTSDAVCGTQFAPAQDCTGDGDARCASPGKCEDVSDPGGAALSVVFTCASPGNAFSAWDVKLFSGTTCQGADLFQGVLNGTGSECSPITFSTAAGSSMTASYKVDCSKSASTTAAPTTGVDTSDRLYSAKCQAGNQMKCLRSAGCGWTGPSSGKCHLIDCAAQATCEDCAYKGPPGIVRACLLWVYCDPARLLLS